MFTFTQNDLPPGPLAKRLLAAQVSVVLTHTHPNAASPVRRHTRTDWEEVDAIDAEGKGGGERKAERGGEADAEGGEEGEREGGDTWRGAKEGLDVEGEKEKGRLDVGEGGVPSDEVILALVGLAEQSATPETDPVVSDDAREAMSKRGVSVDGADGTGGATGSRGRGGGGWGDDDAASMPSLLSMPRGWVGAYGDDDENANNNDDRWMTKTNDDDEDEEEEEEEEDRRFYLSSDQEESINNSTPSSSMSSRRGGDRRTRPPSLESARALSRATSWSLPLTGPQTTRNSNSSGLLVPGQHGFPTPARNGHPTPARSGHPTPARHTPSHSGYATPARNRQTTPGHGAYSTPARVGRATPGRAGYGTPSHGGYMTPGRGGYTTPLSSNNPSPLRSCPRAAVSAKKERLNERHARKARDGPPAPVVVLKDPPDVRLWSSSKILQSPAILDDLRQPLRQQLQQQQQQQPASAASGGAAAAGAGAGVAGADEAEVAEASGAAAAVVGPVQGWRRATVPPSYGESSAALATRSGRRSEEDAESHGAGGSASVARKSLGQGSERENQTPRMVPPLAATSPRLAQARGPPVRLDKVLLLKVEGSRKYSLSGLEKGKKDGRGSSPGDGDDVGGGRSGGGGSGGGGGGGGGGGNGVEKEGEGTTIVVTVRKDAPKEKASRRSSSPEGTRLLLQTAAQRSFEDETDQSDAGSAGGGWRGGSSFSDGDGETAALAARVLAGWVDNGEGEAAPAASLLNEERRVVSARFIENENLTAIAPLRHRGWPPLQRIVAGEEEIQGALMHNESSTSSPQEQKQQQGQQEQKQQQQQQRQQGQQQKQWEWKQQPRGIHERKYGSTGTSCGEDAKLALARKRLQWEK